MQNDEKVTQLMVFLKDYPKFPGKPKRMKQILLEHGLWVDKLLMKCQQKCIATSVGCCMKQLLKLQPDFEEQHLLVQEVIEETGHLSIFLPKFHCEFNFIEYF